MPSAKLLAINVLRTLRTDLHLGAFGLWVNVFAASPLVPRVLRAPALRVAGVRIGRAHVWPGVTFGHWNATIGKEVVINRGCLLDAFGGIEIGDATQLGQQVSVVTATHEIGTSDRRAGASYSQAVTIGRGCWIGARAVVLPGVTIGHGCIIAAGSVVTKDCDPNGLYGGVPARRIRELGR